MDAYSYKQRVESNLFRLEGVLGRESCTFVDTCVVTDSIGRSLNNLFDGSTFIRADEIEPCISDIQQLEQILQVYGSNLYLIPEVIKELFGFYRKMRVPMSGEHSIRRFDAAYRVSRKGRRKKQRFKSELGEFRKSGVDLCRRYLEFLQKIKGCEFRPENSELNSVLMSIIDGVSKLSGGDCQELKTDESLVVAAVYRFLVGSMPVALVTRDAHVLKLFRVCFASLMLAGKCSPIYNPLLQRMLDFPVSIYFSARDRNYAIIPGCYNLAEKTNTTLPFILGSKHYSGLAKKTESLFLDRQADLVKAGLCSYLY